MQTVYSSIGLTCFRMTGSTQSSTAITHAKPALPLTESTVRAAGSSLGQKESIIGATKSHAIAGKDARTAGREMAQTAMCVSLVMSRAPHARMRTSMHALTVLQNSLTEWLENLSVTIAASEAYTRQLLVTLVRHVTTHAVTVNLALIAALGATLTVCTLSFTSTFAKKGVL